MKKLIFLLSSLSIVLISCCGDCENPNKEIEQVIPPIKENEAPVFDSLKAYKYGADDYGMKMYVMAFLRKGPNRDRDSSEAYDLQRAHLDNINRLVEEGKMVLAGPFGGDGDLRGIYIFNVETVEEAKALTNSDPAIQAGSLEMELIPWYGSAAVVGIVDEHAKIAKINI